MWCPFCLSSKVAVTGDLSAARPFEGFAMACDSCGAQGPVFSTEPRAIEAWNMRKREAQS
jgi:Lar family restriction alleviation protein